MARVDSVDKLTGIIDFLYSGSVIAVNEGNECRDCTLGDLEESESSEIYLLWSEKIDDKPYIQRK